MNAVNVNLITVTKHGASSGCGHKKHPVQAETSCESSEQASRMFDRGLSPSEVNGRGVNSYLPLVIISTLHRASDFGDFASGFFVRICRIGRNCKDDIHFTITSRSVVTVRSHEDKQQNYLCCHIRQTEFNEDTR
jgi:hypothetical protein